MLKLVWLRLFAFFLSANIGLADLYSDTSLPERLKMREFDNKILSKLITKKYHELDEIAENIRNKNERTVHGWPKLDYFYSALVQSLYSLPPTDEFESWRRLKFFQEWVDKNPSSITAKIALGKFYIDYARLVRTLGKTHDGKDWRETFNARLTKAEEILKEAEKSTTQDPQLYCERMRCILCTHSSKEEAFDLLFRKVIEIDPSYYPAYAVKAINLLPSRYGKHGDFARFAEDAQDLSGEGSAIYARIVSVIVLVEGDRELTTNKDFTQNVGLIERNSLSWPKLKEGFRALEKSYPDSLIHLNFFCFFSCLAGDYEAAHSLFERLGDRWDSKLWKSKSRFEYWQQLVNLSKKMERATFQGKGGEVNSIAFTLDDQMIVAGYASGEAVLWDITTGKPKNSLKGHTKSIESVSISQDGKMVATGSADSTIKLWELSTGSIKDTFTGNNGSVDSIAFSSDNRMLATCSSGQVKLWDLNTKEAQDIPLDTGYNGSLAFFSDNKLLAIGGCHTLRVWDLIKNSAWENFIPNDPWPGLRYWDLRKKAISNNFNVNGGQYGHIFSIAISPDGKILATSSGSGLGITGSSYSQTGSVWFRDTVDGKETDIFIKDYPSGIRSIAFSPSGKTLAAANLDGSIILWEVATGEKQKMLLGHTAGVNEVAFSSDGKILASGSYDGTVKLWNVDLR